MSTRRTAALLGMGMLTGAAWGQECGLTAVAAVGGFASEITALPGRRAAVARGMALELYSLEDPRRPVLIDRLDQTVVHEHWGPFDRLASSGALVCAIQNGWLNVFDTSGDRVTRLASRRTVKPDGTSTNVAGMYLEGSRVYVTGDGVLEILDLSDPRNPSAVARTATTWGPAKIDGSGGWVYVASSAELRYADCTGPSIVLRTFALGSFWCPQPKVVGGVVFVRSASSRTDMFPAGVEITGSLGSFGEIGCPPTVAAGPGPVRFTADSGVLTALDLSNPASPVVLGQAGPEVSVRTMALVEPGLIAATTVAGGLQVVDASDPAHMVLVSETPADPGLVWSIARSGNVAWVTADFSRVEAYDLSDPARPMRVSELFRDGSRSSVTTVAVQDGLMAVTSQGPSGMTRLDLVDVSDARNPQPRGSVAVPVRNDSLATVVLANGIAAVGNSLGSSVRLVDISNIEAPRVRGSAPSGAEGGLALRGALLFARGEGRLSVFDVSDPDHPVTVRSQIATSGVGQMAVRGDVLAASLSPSSGIWFFDISSPASGIPTIRRVTPSARTMGLDWTEPDLAFGGPGLIDTSEINRAYARFQPLTDAGLPPVSSRVAGFPGFLALAQGPDGLVVYPLTSGGPPAVRSSLPARATACVGRPFELTVDVAAETQPLAYQWFRSQTAIPGADGPTLRIEAFSPLRDGGSYRCVISNACGTVREPASGFVVVGSCTADFNCDGIADWSDYTDYVDAFETNDRRADCNFDDFVDFFDYDDFVRSFQRGC